MLFERKAGFRSGPLVVTSPIIFITAQKQPSHYFLAHVKNNLLKAVKKKKNKMKKKKKRGKGKAKRKKISGRGEGWKTRRRGRRRGKSGEREEDEISPLVSEFSKPRMMRTGFSSWRLLSDRKTEKPCG